VTDTLEIDFNLLPTSYLLDSLMVCKDQDFTVYSPFPSLVNIWNDSIYQDSVVLNFSVPAYLTLELNSVGACVSLDSLYIIPYSPIAIISDIGWIMEANLSSYYQWIYNGSPISNANARTYLPLNNGDYQVYIIDSLNCANTSDIFTVSTAGITQTNQKVDIYKTNDRIILKDIPTNAIAELYDISGKLLSRKILIEQNTFISIPKTEQVYILKILTANGKKIATKKL
jgi:hypothetical protein